jgi:glycosyltransferase involved in cell wall biosynthesis
LIKVYINGRFLSQQITGVQRYGRELLAAIDTILAEGEESKVSIEVLVPRTVTNPPSYRRIRIRRVGWLTGQAWEQFELPWYCAGELLFTPCGGAPLLHKRNVVTIHDAAVFAAPYGYSFWFRVWYRFLYKRLGKSAIRIVTVSNFSKSELIRLCGIDADKVSVTYLGSDHTQRCTPDYSVLERNNLDGKKFVLAVSSRNPNKNFHGLVSAMSSLTAANINVVVAGGTDRSVFKDEAEIPDAVSKVGYVSDSELTALYTQAACFVFPSFYEGFGLPPLEALSLGCPVVVSRAASLQELFGTVALLCDPFDPADIVDKVIRAASGEIASRDTNVKFASTFTWEQCARATLAILEDASTAS